MTDNNDCICKGNWQKIVKETSPFFGCRFTFNLLSYTLIGILYGIDDYYYCMIDTDGRIFNLSCVVSIEGHGFRLVE